MTEELIFRSDEASKGGFQGIKQIEGILLSPKRVPSKFADTTTEDGRTIVAKDQVEVVLEDALILEMEEGEVEPELREGRFTFWMNYAPPGKAKAHQNTFYIKGFTTSAENLAKAQGNPDGSLPDFFNTRVTLERQSIVLFRRPIQGSEEKEEISSEGFVFVEGGQETGKSIEEHIKGLLIGLNKQAALRNLLMDNRAKRCPEYKGALTNETIASQLGLVVVDGIFREGEIVTEEESNEGI